MGKTRSSNRDKALEIYMENNGDITPREIAKILGESAANISSWKNKDNWNEKLPPNKGGAPKGNLNSLKYGHYYDPTKHLEESFLKKYLPTTTKNIIKGTVEAGLNSLDILWTDIHVLFASVIASQKIMYVKSKSEMIKELKKSKKKNKNRNTQKTSTDESEEEFEYEFQFAWDRQATFLDSQSKTMAELRSHIKQYEESLHKNWDLATEEQKLRVQKLKAEITNIIGNDNTETEDDGFIKALEGKVEEDWNDEENNK
ncbi:phage terminase small subunit [Clostridium puniceum]|uniref:Phage terminase small subunit n=1 Tax=Clostridium puniceum TaxID=29367 RepID=A0A1S8T8Q7_9CLOT|nr:phage terminase small subunit [Clostridium puniceum]OOM73981.1 phage terminase small subunit [Clostridium puniceum]